MISQVKARLGVVLVKAHDWMATPLESRAEQLSLRAEIAHLRRRIRALQGVVTRLKKRN